MIEIISTRRYAPRERLDFWNELIGSTYDGMVVDSGPDVFNAHLGVWQLADLRIARPHSCPALITRHQAQRSVRTKRTYIAHVLTQGQVELEQRGRKSELVAGDMVLCAAEEFYRFNAITTHEMVVVEFDASVLSSRLPNIDDHVARTISGKLPGTRIVQRYMTSLWQEARENLPPVHTKTLAKILVDLTVACLEESGAPASPASDPMLCRMRDVIAARLEDFDFGPAAVAEEMGISLRTAQTVAARAGTTIGQMITEHRLQKAVRLLSSRSYASIADIAFDCGFSDPSYFTRRFQNAYGASPSRFRSSN